MASLLMKRLIVFTGRKNSHSFATSAKVAMNEFAQKRTNSATHHTGCKALQSTYMPHICNKFAQGKFYANSFFRPVICTKYISSLSASIDFFYLCFTTKATICNYFVFFLNSREIHASRAKILMFV